MVKTLKIITTTEQVIELDIENNVTTIISEKILSTKVLDNDTESQLNLVTKIHLKASNFKYGYVALTKGNPYRKLHDPSAPINVSINGATPTVTKWHSSQPRIDGLSGPFARFSQSQNLESKVFALSYDPATNTLNFDED